MRLSHSRASTFLTCPRKYKYSYIDNREPIEPDEVLEFGTAWHGLLEAHYKGLGVPALRPNPAKKLTKHSTAFLNRAYDLYRGFHQPFDEVLMVEEEREVPLGPDVLVCRFDGLVRHAGEVWVLEIKTTSSDISPGSYYWERLVLNQQVSWYLLAATQLGHKPAGVIYDVLRKPNLRRGKNETADEFTSRCLTDLNRYPEKYFARETITRTNTELLEAETNLHEIAKLCEAGVYPQNTSACFNFGRQCEFGPVCGREASLSDDRIYRLKVKQ